MPSRIWLMGSIFQRSGLCLHDRFILYLFFYFSARHGVVGP